MCKIATKNYMPCKSVVLETFATIDPLQLSIMESPLSDFEIAREPSVWLYKWALPMLLFIPSLLDRETFRLNSVLAAVFPLSVL